MEIKVSEIVDALKTIAEVVKQFGKLFQGMDNVLVNKGDNTKTSSFEELYPEIPDEELQRSHQPNCKENNKNQGEEEKTS